MGDAVEILIHCWKAIVVQMGRNMLISNKTEQLFIQNSSDCISILSLALYVLTHEEQAHNVRFF